LELEGGANDVALMRQLLTEKYRFPAKNIVVLSEAEGTKDAARLPTRKNIERECKRLAALAKAGDQVVIMLSGHGSQQPEKEGAKDPYPDGMDRIFLPRDVRGWELGVAAVPNAISGRELGEWLRPVPTRKATLWVIVDACHSGEMLRGAGEKPRQVDAAKGLKVPDAEFVKARKRAQKQPKQAPGPLARLGQLNGVALLYACQPSEVTVECLFPREDPKGRPHGLLTYTLARVLRSSTAPLSYRELAHRVRAEYVAMERTFPTPVIEGKGSNHDILGADKVERSTVLVTADDDVLTVNAGRLHGVTTGSILVVYPPPGEKGELRGHLRVTKAKVATAEVEPCAFASVKAPTKKSVLGGRCEVAQVDYGDLQLKVALDRAGSKARPADLENVARALAAWAKKPGAPVKYLADAKTADWLVRVRDGKATLIRAAEWDSPAPKRGKQKRTVLGPWDVGKELGEELKASLTKIARAQNLLKVAAQSLVGVGDGRGDFSARVKVEIVREGARGKEVTTAGTVPLFYDRDKVQFRVKNTGKVPVDVTLLYVDSAFGIEALFPDKENNRLRPGATVRVPTVDVNAKTTGREYVVVLAVKSEGLQPVDFTALAQKSVKRFRAKESERGQRGGDSPLGKLMRNAIYKDGQTREMSRPEMANYTLNLIPVQVMAGSRPDS
jgi:hypothetical protein